MCQLISFLSMTHMYSNEAAMFRPWKLEVKTGRSYQLGAQLFLTRVTLYADTQLQLLLEQIHDFAAFLL